MVKETEKRKATTSEKAKKAAAIAAAESKEEEDDDGKKGHRKRGRPRKDKGDDTPAQDDKAVDEEDVSQATPAAAVDIDWNGDVTLTWTLIKGIEEDDDTRRALFPPPGSTKRNGGLPKKHYHQLLADICFKEHDNYKEAYAKAKKPKQRDIWSGKIKNRIKVVSDQTRQCIKMMGETGAGIESPKDILPGTVLKTKWDEIQDKLPWFWNVRSLIGERPNLMPVGIGNTSSDMDTSILLPGHNDGGASDPSSPDIFPTIPELETGTESDVLDLDLEGEEEPASGDDMSVKRAKRKKPSTPDDSSGDDDDTSDGRVKRKKSSTPAPVPVPKKTKPKPAMSTPVPVPAKPVKPAKPSTAKDRFSAAVVAEEETQQQLLALKTAKNRDRKEVEVAKIRALAEVKVEATKGKTQERLAKLELARLKIQQDHELRMAQLAHSSHAGPSNRGSAHHRSNFDDDEPFAFAHLPRLTSTSGDAGSSSASTAFDPEWPYTT
ncbi:hypothetical protein B0H11DRAFT_2235347 [Mycena galericulata]|nr:hypothetical protein B0H11DRAFT_2235347 [Mycena galericulata]